MLKIDFYESGDGETILLTFPNGGVGIVDAHPSPHSSRPSILELIRDRVVHFVCLTHPHRDHGVDLIPVLERHSEIEAFWHTVSDVDVTVFLQQDAMSYPDYPSDCRGALERMKRGWAEFLIDLYGAVASRPDLKRHQLRSDLRPEIIDGVEIHILGPDESVSQRFVDAHQKRLRDIKTELPDPNLLSAILAIKYGGVVILLGADALQENWRSATNLFFKDNLPKAKILKVPHHGAKNALQLQRSGHEHNYLDVCSSVPPVKSVLFAGDAKHPDPSVFKHLLLRTDPVCVSNGIKDSAHDTNPLNIRLIGARVARLPQVCNPVVSFTIDAVGVLSQTHGGCDKRCMAFTL